ncbi:hypothetical protein COW99_02375 [Candidatus Roizmanbacteria bacterium CG22_combo_CG10-13_8_21_14_all_38_20]|uniref:Uncharacterized protein n=1 Tax=Candidatus Roizmanbacteria bacterium CG22_combo_CG10-13_8_21_14_all_38_20 TaxID=1974862 RepID=A0A2H0BVJ2_9BACT|nr:MAG: hypothetical protein COW99_02375 [Candidatus Roizmanbacteria bacterium CG22_combo_CG10-13_8_21_14_all_38_20]
MLNLHNKKILAIYKNDRLYQIKNRLKKTSLIVIVVLFLLILDSIITLSTGAPVILNLYSATVGNKAVFLKK